MEVETNPDLSTLATGSTLLELDEVTIQEMDQTLKRIRSEMERAEVLSSRKKERKTWRTIFGFLWQ